MENNFEQNKNFESKEELDIFGSIHHHVSTFLLSARLELEEKNQALNQQHMDESIKFLSTLKEKIKNKNQSSKIDELLEILHNINEKQKINSEQVDQIQTLLDEVMEIKEDMG